MPYERKADDREVLIIKILMSSEVLSGYVRFEVYVPSSHAKEVKAAICEAGAGKLGNYDSCIWETVGTGQFRPLEGSNPYLGSTNQIETVEEVKLECICEQAKVKGVITAMKKAHPYETVAFAYWPVFLE